MDWYYALGGERFGPFDQDGFDLMVAQGRITGVTLVWREGLTDWVQYQYLSGPAEAAPGELPPVLVQCSQCLRQAAGDDMIQYQGFWVCAECKDTFYQRIREGNFIPQEPQIRQQPWEQARRRFAGFWIRVGATLLDVLILLPVHFVLMLIFMNRMFTAGPPPPLMTLIQLIIGISYTTFFLGKFGATPGKMACGLKVIVSNGRPVSYLRSFGRYWAVGLSGLIPYISAGIAMVAIMAISLHSNHYGRPGPRDVEAALAIGALVAIPVGLLMAFPLYMAGMTKQKCALHDFICNTRVIHKR